MAGGLLGPETCTALPVPSEKYKPLPIYSIAAASVTSEFVRPRIDAMINRLGVRPNVTLDLEGFRSGSMNQLLTAEELLRGKLP